MFSSSFPPVSPHCSTSEGTNGTPKSRLSSRLSSSSLFALFINSECELNGCKSSCVDLVVFDFLRTGLPIARFSHRHALTSVTHAKTSSTHCWWVIKRIDISMSNHCRMDPTSVYYNALMIVLDFFKNLSRECRTGEKICCKRE
jgi:hypothetical protein